MANSKVIEKRHKRKQRVTRSVKKFNKGQKPILNVFRSNKNIRAQIVGIDGKVLVSVASNIKELAKTLKGKSGIEIAKVMGEKMAKEAVGKKIKEVIFNKGSYRYIGRIQAFCEEARKNGLLF